MDWDWIDNIIDISWVDITKLIIKQIIKISVTNQTIKKSSIHQIIIELTILQIKKSILNYLVY